MKKHPTSVDGNCFYIHDIKTSTTSTITSSHSKTIYRSPPATTNTRTTPDDDGRASAPVHVLRSTTSSRTKDELFHGTDEKDPLFDIYSFCSRSLCRQVYDEHSNYSALNHIKSPHDWRSFFKAYKRSHWTNTGLCNGFI